MTVRWKPLILLTALFVVMAAMGLLAIASVLMSEGAEELLKQAQAEARAGRYDRAVLQYERALQREPRSAKAHLALAETLGDWMAKEPSEAPRLRAKWLGALNQAARLAEQSADPRRMLLADALAHEEWDDAVHWASELISLDPDDADALYVTALDHLDRRPPKVDEARPLVERLSQKEPGRDRARWTRARLAESSNDEAALEKVLAEPASASPALGTSDALARLRLAGVALGRAREAGEVAARIEALCVDAEAVIRRHDAPGVARQVSRQLEPALRQIRRGAAGPVGGERATALESRLVDVATRAFETSVAGAGANDLRPYQGYAEFLLIADRREKCVEVVLSALKQPAAAAPIWIPVAMELREIAIKSLLADGSDPERFTRAAPLVGELMASTTPRYQALGHLFQGVMELERALSGAGNLAETDRGALQTSALGHLRLAAEGLEDVATAQALYGMALLIAKEPNLGRQYLAKARQLGGDALDPRYQFWAALSILQAGYPEDALPLVSRLRERAESGGVESDLVGMVHFVEAECLAALSRPAEARAAYERARGVGYANPGAIDVRLAQLATRHGDATEALRELNSLNGDEAAGVAAERLAVLTLREKGKTDEARTRLAEARKRYPTNAELVGIEAAIRAEEGDAGGAFALADAFLRENPAEEELAIFRAKLLAGPLGKPDEARRQLASMAEAATHSAPLVQLILLDMGRGDLNGAEKSIVELRSRFGDGATADLLEAQVALARGETKSAATLLDAALQKDPTNKVVLYWKARLGSVNGAARDAEGILQGLLRDRPTKEMSDGVSLTAAAQFALGSIAMERRDYGVAVSRFEEMLRQGGEPGLQRSLRWNLAQARAASGDAARARAEVEQLLTDPGTTAEERVQAADLFRRLGDADRARREIDTILAADPRHPGGVTYRAMMLVSEQKPEEAARLVREAMGDGPAPVGFHLLLAALENLSGDGGTARARQTLEQGLETHPGNAELLRALYQVASLAKEADPVGVVLARVSDPESPAVREVLIEAYEGERRYDEALKLLDKETESAAPGSGRAATLAARSIALGLAAAGREADGEARRRRLRDVGERISAAREAYPSEPRFLALEGEHALAEGDLPRATKVADELAERDSSSPDGPILQARVALARRDPEAAARAYERAIERSPTRPDLRITLGQMQLAGGKYDAALQQATAVLAENAGLVGAKFLQAQALALGSTPGAGGAARRAEAAKALDEIIATTPQFAEAYHLRSDLALAGGDREAAIKTLELALSRMPDDDEALLLLVQRLAEPPAAGRAADAAALERAGAAVRAATAEDSDGRMALAAALGYHRAGRSDLALPWAERAAERSTSAVAHLALGDILLAGTERGEGAPASRAMFERAVASYDRVLREEPGSIEAGNNKAWILHRYLGRHDEALAVAEEVARRHPPDELPPDFHDTLGSIQKAAGQTAAAEATFRSGLSQVPDHPVLNLHMAQLMAEAPGREESARDYLARARRGRAALSADLANELDALEAALGASR
jgi:tetratricopeptide (TPR) repeat protein